MGAMRATGKTVGEVERLTGIPKRRLKYFIEQNLLQPSQKSESGYWLYTEEDIKKVRIISLCKALDYPDQAVRTILEDAPARWQAELEQQIIRLSDQKDGAEARLFLAELLRYSYRTGHWTGELDGVHLPPAIRDCLVWEGEVLRWREKKKDSLCRYLYQMFLKAESPLCQFAALGGERPHASAVQTQAARLSEWFWEQQSLSADQLLFALRLVHLLEGVEPLLEQRLHMDGGIRFITEAVQYYCDDLTEKEHVMATL